MKTYEVIITIIIIVIIGSYKEAKGQITFPEQEDIIIIKEQGWDTSLFIEVGEIAKEPFHKNSLKNLFPELTADTSFDKILSKRLTVEQKQKLQEISFIPASDIKLEVPLDDNIEPKFYMNVFLIRIYRVSGVIFCYKVSGFVKGYNVVTRKFDERYRSALELEYYDEDGNGSFEKCIGSKQFLSLPSWVIDILN